jgi:hypothetical protein
MSPEPSAALDVRPRQAPPQPAVEIQAAESSDTQGDSHSVDCHPWSRYWRAKRLAPEVPAPARTEGGHDRYGGSRLSPLGCYGVDPVNIDLPPYEQMVPYLAGQATSSQPHQTHLAYYVSVAPGPGFGERGARGPTEPPTPEGQS